MADALLGTAMPANVLALGAAYPQAGGIPGVGRRPSSGPSSSTGVAVAANLAAFRWGRVYVREGRRRPGQPGRHARRRAARRAGRRARPGPGLGPGQGQGAQPGRWCRTRAWPRRSARTPRLWPSWWSGGAADLVDYQSAALASEYVDFVDAASAREREVMGDRTELSSSVARHLYKLLAYKDEYEVARLHLRPGVAEAMRDAVGDFGRHRILLHPPVLRAMGLKAQDLDGAVPAAGAGAAQGDAPRAGHPVRPVRIRQRCAGWERELIAEYRTLMETELDGLTPASYERAVRLARLPDVIQGLRGREAGQRGALPRRGPGRACPRSPAGSSQPRSRRASAETVAEAEAGAGTDAAPSSDAGAAPVRAVAALGGPA